ncbi:hypothetical protein U1Q18_019031 [Sarracenia purpurea var. burkii]
MAEALLSVLLQNLNTLIQKEFGLLWGVDKDMKKLVSVLSAIQAVIDDAEEKQLSDRAIRDWLRKLKYAAYDLEDILDDCSTEALKWEYKGQSSGSLKKATTSLLIYPVANIIFRHKIGTRMKAIKEELGAIADERNKYNLQVVVSVADKHVEHAKSRETSSDLTESLLLGRDEDKEKIIKVLVEDVCDSEGLSVYPIVVVDKDGIKEMFIYRTNNRGYEMHQIGCTTWFKMHDLMHDLAQSVMEDEGWIKGTENSSAMSNKMVRCVSSSMLQQENHEARFPFRRGKSNFKKFGSLRVACGGGGGMSNLPSSIGNLKHLRYLDISCSYIEQLPDSICSLWNLQTLILDYCHLLERLPKNMNYLRGLRHLYLTECPLSDMPPKIGQLTCLKTLSLFVMGESMKCSQLAELQHLNLGGKLCIEHLERVRIPTDAKKAKLVEKENLCSLKLSWEYIAESKSQENVEEVLEALEPHPNLKELIINNYGGTRLPPWMKISILENIVVLELINCINCFQLPPLGQLPLLQRLKIVGMDKVEYIDSDLCCEGPVRGFPSLEKLEISSLPNLEGLSRDEGRELLPRLRKIKVSDCPKLRFPCLSSPKVLEVNSGCTNVVLNSISNLNSLSSLRVSGNQEVICFPIELLRNLTLLESLTIWGFSKLKMFPDELARLVAFKRLDISGCIELEYLPVEGLESLRHLGIYTCCKLSSLSEGFGHPEGVKHLNSLRELILDGRGTLYQTDVKSVPWIEGVQHIPALESLGIINYYEITSLPDWLGNLTSLQSLRIWGCPKIASLPASIQGLTKLNQLHISSCSPELKKRCQRGTGEDWDKIKHVPRVCLRGLESLRALYIHDCCKLSFLSEGLGHLTSLETLLIARCPGMVAFPEVVKHLNSLRHLTLNRLPMLSEGLQHIPALESLSIWHYYEITSLPDCLGNLTSLQSLDIWDCPKIASLPASIQGLTKLNELRILSCSPELEKRCQKVTGEDWYKIAHVPEVWINSLDLQ